MRYFEPTPRVNRLSKKARTVAEMQEGDRVKRNKNELSKFYWLLRERSYYVAVKWKIRKKAFPYRNGMKFCDLCTTESTEILLEDPLYLLNKRNEVFHKCTDKNQFKLANIK